MTRILFIAPVHGRSTGSLTYANLLRITKPEDVDATFLDTYDGQKADIIHFTDVKKASLQEIAIASKRGRVIVDVHDYAFAKFISFPTPDLPLRYLLHHFRRGKYWKAISMADATIVHSRYVQNIIKGSSLVYIGLPEISIKSSDHRDGLIFAGRDFFQKGLATVIKAFRKLRKKGINLSLSVVGREYIHSKLLFRLMSTGLDVRFIDEMEWKKLLEEYGRNRIFLRPSYLEGFGLSILEAMRMGTPPIATEVGGIPEIVESGKSGILIRPGDVDALAGAIEDLLDPSIWKKTSDAARERSMQFTAERMWNSLIRLYSELS